MYPQSSSLAPGVPTGPRSSGLAHRRRQADPLGTKSRENKRKEGEEQRTDYIKSNGQNQERRRGEWRRQREYKELYKKKIVTTEKCKDKDKSRKLRTLEKDSAKRAECVRINMKRRKFITDVILKTEDEKHTHAKTQIKINVNKNN